QYELLGRADNSDAIQPVWDLVEDRSVDLESRVAALYTYTQLTGEAGIQKLVEAATDADLQEYALRALADRKALANKVPAEPFLAGLRSSSPRVKAASIIGVGRLGIKEAI